MPLTVENFIQENTGISSAVVTLPSGTTAGNTLIVFFTAASGMTAPAGQGWATDKSSGAFELQAFRKSDIPASETSWTFTGTPYCWYVAELSNVDLVDPLDASATTVSSVPNGGTAPSGTTPPNAGLNTVVFAAWDLRKTAADTASWDGYTNDFEEVADLGSGVNLAQLAVARKFITGTTGTFSSTATLATSGGSTTSNRIVVVYRAADSPIMAPLAMLTGFEGGTHGGINSHSGSSNLMGSFSTHTGTWGTNYLIQAGSARNSGYGLRVVQTGAAAYVYMGNFTTNPRAASFGFNVRVVSATGTVVVASVGGGSLASSYAQLLYDATNSKFGVRCGTTGTASWQSGTTATNTWVWVDLRVRVSTTTWHAEWRLETAADTYTDQAAADLAGQSITTLPWVSFGVNAAQTMTADFDDAVVSLYWVAYPLGPHEVRLLGVDTGGTPTISGTSTNFSRFTANGTLAAINAATAAALVDEVPPTISASADGVCQTAVAASDYIEFPMATPTVAADEIVAGVRSLVPMWGGTGSGTGTVGVRGYDGTAETTLTPASTSYDAGSPTAVSSTEPRWECAMWQQANGWTVAKLAAAALRFGFSSDATPDMGCHSLYLEYAARKTNTNSVLGEAGSVVMDANTNPNTVGIRSAVLTTPPERGSTLMWTKGGTPSSQFVPADTVHTETIDEDVTYMGVESEPS